MPLTFLAPFWEPVQTWVAGHMTLCFSGSVESMQHNLLGAVLKASSFAQLHPPLPRPRNSAHLLKKIMCQLGQAEQRGAEFF